MLLEKAPGLGPKIGSVDFAIPMNLLTKYPSPTSQGRECLCSRCGEAIMGPELAVRLVQTDHEADGEYRFHVKCFNEISGNNLGEAWVKLSYLEDM